MDEFATKCGGGGPGPVRGPRRGIRKFRKQTRKSPLVDKVRRARKLPLVLAAPLQRQPRGGGRALRRRAS